MVKGLGFRVWGLGFYIGIERDLSGYTGIFTVT